ncbi:hypothetical protein PYX06_16460 [Citrobacter amalonaticus]|nr:hypothetical protein [Citrobacter amalonaticus]
MSDDIRTKGNVLRHDWQHAQAQEGAQSAFSDNFTAFSYTQQEKKLARRQTPPGLLFLLHCGGGFRGADSYQYD